MIVNQFVSFIYRNFSYYLKKKQMDIPDNVCRTNSYAVNVNDFYIYDMIIINVFYSKVQYLNH